MDQTLEVTANKDTQTAGRIRRFSLNAGVVSHYYITAYYKKYCVRQSKEMVNSIKSESA